MALVAALAALSAGVARAQEPRPSTSVPANMQPGAAEARPSGRVPPPQVVDPGIADRNSLGQSLRVMPVDLSPHGFERVYAVPGRDDLLMRSDGALYAVFSQSTYSRDPRKGTMRALVPASTVFFIGRPDFAKVRSAGVRDVDLSPGSRAAPVAAAAAAPGATRIDARPVDLRVAGDAQRIDGASDGRFRAPPAPEDPVPPAVHGPPAPAERAAPAPPSESRESRPGFRDRIDELMRRAKQPK